MEKNKIKWTNKIYKMNANPDKFEIFQLKSTINHNFKVLLNNKKVLDYKLMM